MALRRTEYSAIHASGCDGDARFPSERVEVRTDAEGEADRPGGVVIVGMHGEPKSSNQREAGLVVAQVVERSVVKLEEILGLVNNGL